ncbi:MAG: hypothetical protein IK012_03650 [Fibrobacter sp.]|uniref:hypothetical protein n=1 Tax=Fibrobacter sp. TaxID=35828 RepID=UPI0025C15DDD|nr:hypothetical protein [Fibrobacter sp.]MBR4784331.1 hypothetical protein [Fibrobacter sp.]
MTILRIFICILALVPFVSCTVDLGSSSTEEEEYFDETPRSYEVRVSLDMGLFPDSVYVTFLDKRLRGIETVNAWPISVVGSDWLYQTDPISVRASYIRMDIVKIAENNGNEMRMVFSRYAKADAYLSRLNLNTALAIKTVDRLMKKENLPYDSAMSVAYANMDDFFGIEDYDYEYHGFSNYGNEIQPYLYCRYFDSDSVFYSDFGELVDAIDAGEWGDTLFRVRAADGLVRSFVANRWRDFRGLQLFNSSEAIPEFWEKAYGMEFCTEARIGDTIANGNRKSDFYDSVFVCDLNLSLGPFLNGKPHWRPVTSEDRELGFCLYGNEAIVEKDSVFYHCSKGYWQKEDDMNIVINKLYASCNSNFPDKLYDFRGKTYICHQQTVVDSTFYYMGLGYTTQRTEYVWTDDQAVIDSVYPGGVADSSLIREEEGDL